MVIAALAIRLAVMGFLYTRQLDPARDHFAFGYETGRIARSLASGKGFSSPYPEPTGPTALMAPAYPCLLAGIFKLFGVYSTASALFSLTLNNLFSALTCVPVFLIARKMLGIRAAAWAGWTWAFFPYAVELANLWVWETSLTTLLLSLLLLSTLRLERDAPIRGWLGYGLLWGLTALVNPTVLSAMPVLWAWISYRRRQRGLRSGRLFAATAFVFVLSVTPWLVRNYQTFGHFIFFRNNFGLEFQVGNGDDASSEPGSDHLLPADNPAEMQRVQQLGEAAYLREKRDEAMEFIEQHTGRFAWLTLRRILCVWTAVWSAHPNWQLDEEFGIPNVFAYTFLTVLALLGLRAVLRDSREYAIPLIGLLICFPLVYYITHPDIRYRHPIDPEIVILATYGVFSRFSRHAEKSPPAQEPLSTPEESLVALGSAEH